MNNNCDHIVKIRKSHHEQKYNIVVSNVHLLGWESRCNNVIYTDHVAVTLRRAMINGSTDLRDGDYN